MTSASPIPSRRAEVGPAALAVAALLLVLLLFQLVLPHPQTAPAARSLLTAPAADPAVADVPEYPQVLMRPLFAPTRSGDETGADATSASVQLSDFSVVGVAIGRGLATAVVRGPGGETRTLRPGDRLLGWTVTAIGRDAVALASNGRTKDLPVTAQPASALAPLR